MCVWYAAYTQKSEDNVGGWIALLCSLRWALTAFCWTLNVWSSSSSWYFLSSCLMIIRIQTCTPVCGDTLGSEDSISGPHTGMPKAELTEPSLQPISYRFLLQKGNFEAMPFVNTRLSDRSIFIMYLAFLKYFSRCCN